MDHPGASLLFRAASGFEKALADTDAERLIAIEAEKIIESWDPDKIDYQLLPYLAWAYSVNLWEDDWTEETKRWWVGVQWLFKSLRGTYAGIDMALTVNDAHLLRALTPPATFYPGHSTTPEEQQAFLDIFPQLRVFPYTETPLQIGDCFMTWPGSEDNQNGKYFGPLLPFYPTHSPFDGFYRTAVIWDHGVEQPVDLLTLESGDDQISALPRASLSTFYLGYWPLFFGNLDKSENYLYMVARNNYRITFTSDTTVPPGFDFIDVRPQMVAEEYTVPQFTAVFPAAGQFPMGNAFLVPSDAWKHLYERWYIHDPDRVLPNGQQCSTFFGNARFGMPKYTAELLIDLPCPWSPIYFGNLYMSGYLQPSDQSQVLRAARSVIAAKAFRDLALMDFEVVREVQVSDDILCDGSVNVGGMIAI